MKVGVHDTAAFLVEERGLRHKKAVWTTGLGKKWRLFFAALEGLRACGVWGFKSWGLWGFGCLEVYD